MSEENLAFLLGRAAGRTQAQKEAAEKQAFMPIGSPGKVAPGQGLGQLYQQGKNFLFPPKPQKLDASAPQAQPPIGGLEAAAAPSSPIGSAIRSVGGALAAPGRYLGGAARGLGAAAGQAVGGNVGGQISRMGGSLGSALETPGNTANSVAGGVASEFEGPATVAKPTPRPVRPKPVVPSKPPGGPQAPQPGAQTQTPAPAPAPAPNPLSGVPQKLVANYEANRAAGRTQMTPEQAAAHYQANRSQYEIPVAAPVPTPTSAAGTGAPGFLDSLEKFKAYQGAATPAASLQPAAPAAPAGPVPGASLPPSRTMAEFQQRQRAFEQAKAKPGDPTPLADSVLAGDKAYQRIQANKPNMAQIAEQGGIANDGQAQQMISALGVAPKTVRGGRGTGDPLPPMARTPMEKALQGNPERMQQLTQGVQDSAGNTWKYNPTTGRVKNMGREIVSPSQEQFAAAQQRVNDLQEARKRYGYQAPQAQITDAGNGFVRVVTPGQASFTRKRRPTDQMAQPAQAAPQFAAN